ncbi:hypothetical protein GCM10009836_56160 [Pseudonocardia ailaonensis]|uniref:DUF4386 domain-containing protein n=1 Tax=Pseudonocardia ailaonensis TaxID=367279 RepID=A0ABN2NGM1_9PSEU
MQAREMLAIGLVAVPGVALGIVGTTHPQVLDPSTAHMWWTMHVALVPVFPLLGLVLVWLVRGRHDPVAWVARVGAYVYATFYTGLDVLAGIAAGRAVELQPEGSPAALAMLRIGNALGDVGSWAYLAAAVATALVVLRRHGIRALPGGVVLVAASVPFLYAHIYWPVGVFSMLGMAVGAALLQGASGLRLPARPTGATVAGVEGTPR